QDLTESAGLAMSGDQVDTVSNSVLVNESATLTWDDILKSSGRGGASPTDGAHRTGPGLNSVQGSAGRSTSAGPHTDARSTNGKGLASRKSTATPLVFLP